MGSGPLTPVFAPAGTASDGDVVTWDSSQGGPAWETPTGPSVPGTAGQVLASAGDGTLSVGAHPLTVDPTTGAVMSRNNTLDDGTGNVVVGGALNVQNGLATLGAANIGTAQFAANTWITASDSTNRLYFGSVNYYQSPAGHVFRDESGTVQLGIGSSGVYGPSGTLTVAGAGGTGFGAVVAEAGTFHGDVDLPGFHTVHAWAGNFWGGLSQSGNFNVDRAMLTLAGGVPIGWSSDPNSLFAASPDLTLSHSAVSTLKVGDGGSGYGALVAGAITANGPIDAYYQTVKAGLFQTSGGWLNFDTAIVIGGNTSTYPVGHIDLAQPVHCRSTLTLANLASAPSGPSAGDSYFDTGLGKARTFDGTIWNNWW